MIDGQVEEIVDVDQAQLLEPRNEYITCLCPKAWTERNQVVVLSQRPIDLEGPEKIDPRNGMSQQGRFADDNAVVEGDLDGHYRAA
jgi:hypothetical protein